MPRRLTAVLDRSGARRSRRPARSDEAPQLAVLRARRTTNHAPVRDAGLQLPSLRRLGAEHRLRSRAALMLAALACGFLIAFRSRSSVNRRAVQVRPRPPLRGARSAVTARPPRHPQGAVLGTVGGDGLAATALHDLHPVAALPALKVAAPPRTRSARCARAPPRRTAGCRRDTTAVDRRDPDAGARAGGRGTGRAANAERASGERCALTALRQRPGSRRAGVRSGRRRKLRLRGLSFAAARPPQRASPRRARRRAVGDGSRRGSSRRSSSPCSQAPASASPRRLSSVMRTRRPRRVTGRYRSGRLPS